MNLCSAMHEEVCYEGLTCPVCLMGEQKNEEIEKKDAVISEKDEKINNLLNEVEDLKLPPDPVEQ